MQFAINALDHTDSEALQRRLANREQHLAGLKKLATNEQLHSAGVIVNDSGDMIGSSVHVSFPNRDQLQQWLDSEPYVTGNVWGKIDVHSIKIVSVDDLLS